jgi:putative ABC transport system permease protein
MMTRVAVRNVMRHRMRTAFTVLALSIAVALLADMLMLSRGMEKTFARVLSSVGYEIRVCPRGTLPFVSESVIAGSPRVIEALRSDPRVARTLSVLATTLHADSLPLSVVGIDGDEQSLYRVIEGRDLSPAGPEELLLNRNAMTDLNAAVGDTLVLRRDAAGTSMAFSPGATFRIVGVLDIQFDLPGQRTAVLPIAAVQRMRNDTAGSASFVLAKIAGDDGFAPIESQRAVAASLQNEFPELSVYAMDSLMEALERQLAYFKQFALILSTISLLVTFLLVAVVLTIGVGERRGEIAALRSMGFRRRSIQSMILSESALVLAMSAVLGAVLGWFLAGYLDRILTQSPSLPEGYHFFIPAWREIALAVALSGAAGILAALLPAIQAARVDIARTLHEEVV